MSQTEDPDLPESPAPGMTDRPEPPPGSNLPLPFGGSGGLPALPPHHQPPVYYPEDEQTISLEHYLHVLLRRRWLLLAVAFTAIVLAALQVFTTTPMYQATARLQVDPDSSKVVPFQEVAGSEMAGCSIDEITRCPSSDGASRIMIPLSARLLLSVPPDVNTISSRSAPISVATWPRASSMASCEVRPIAWPLDGFP